jgi:hypothetical protein
MSVIQADELDTFRTDVLDAATGSTPAAALETLDAALRWTVELLRRMPTAHDDLDGTAFGLVEPLAAALGRSDELGAVLPRFLAIADAGGPPAGELDAASAELAARNAEIRKIQAEIDERTRADRAQAEQVERYRRLREEVEELRRADELAAELPQLTALHADLRGRVEALRLAETEDAVRQAAAEFAELGRIQLARLRPEVRRAQLDAVGVQRRLHQQIADGEQATQLGAAERDRLQAQLTEIRASLETLRTEHDTLYEDVSACAAADAAVAQSIGDLRDAEILLRTVDEKLAAALAAQEQVRLRERKPRFPGDQA